MTLRRLPDGARAGWAHWRKAVKQVEQVRTAVCVCDGPGAIADQVGSAPPR